MAEGSPQTDSDLFVCVTGLQRKSHAVSLWRDGDGTTPAPSAGGPTQGRDERRSLRKGRWAPARAAAPPGSPLQQKPGCGESRVAARSAPGLSTRGQVVARGSAGAWSLLVAGRWRTPLLTAALNFTPPRGPQQAGVRMGTGWRRPALLPGSGQGHPHSAATLPSEHPGGPGGGPRPRTHKAAASLDARAVGAGPELPTLPAGISCHPDLGKVGPAGLLGRASLGTRRAHTGPAGGPLCLPTLADHRERGVLVRLTSGPALHASAGLGQVLWGGGGHQFPGVEGLVGPALALRVCAAWPLVSSGPGCGRGRETCASSTEKPLLLLESQPPAPPPWTRG